MEQVIERRWESSTRYYCARLYTDLFGDVILESAWGGRFNRLGGCATLPVDTMEEGRAVLDQLGKERLARRYDEVGLS
jgi:hypothetical protein